MADVYSEDRVRGIMKEELSSDYFESNVHTIVREELSSDYFEGRVHTIVREELSSDYFENRVRTIVSEEIDKNATIKDLKFEVHRTQVLLEDNTSKLDTVLEILSDYIRTSKRVDGHETRIVTLEDGQTILIKTVKAHSKQLKLT